MVTLSEDGNGIEFGGKVYQFKEPVFAVHIAHAEWVEKLSNVFGETKEADFFVNKKKLKEFAVLWKEYLSIVFVAPDDGLDLFKLTLKDTRRIRDFFLLSSLSLTEPSEQSKTSADSSPEKNEYNHPSPTDGI